MPAMGSEGIQFTSVAALPYRPQKKLMKLDELEIEDQINQEIAANRMRISGHMRMGESESFHGESNKNKDQKKQYMNWMNILS